MVRKIALFLLIGLLITACDAVQSTGDTAADPAAAGNFLPNLSGYSASNADSIVDAVTAISGGASLLSGNPVLAGAIAKIDDVIQCYQDVGAVAANIYTPTDFSNVLEGEVPALGVVAIINQQRLMNNFLACVAGQRSVQGFSAQSAALEPCTGSGTFDVGDNTYTYLYAATQGALCEVFDQHFQAVRQNQGGGN
ncbi:MAG: hypothetical protein D6712_10490 [Chloroflexi bacterium]|nr:MAG: hypothetical protein D6712_10490 [Chloroflexota bacterium]